MGRVRAAEGTLDTLPGRIAAIDHVLASARSVLVRFCYRELRTPVFEERTLFERTLARERSGEVVGLAAPSPSPAAVALRPALWPGLARAYLQHGLDKAKHLHKLFGCGPVADAPPGSPPRQTEVVTALAVGSESPMLDAESIVLAENCLAAAGLTGCTVRVNTVGDAADQVRYREALRSHFGAALDQRCDACQAAFADQPARLLACKAKACQPSNKAAPVMVDSLGEGTRRRFQQVLALLRAARVPYDVDAGLVRHLGNVTHTVFEVHERDAATTPLCTGGRLDDLVRALEGSPTGVMEVSVDVEGVAAALERRRHPAPTTPEAEATAFVVPSDDNARKDAFVLAGELRAAGFAADTDYEGRAAKALHKLLDKRGPRFVVTLALDAAGAPTLTLRDRASDPPADVVVARSEVVALLRGRLRA